jgi:large subunit ribosomal protein L31
MKKGIHPENFRDIIFHDNTSGERFLISSTVESDEKDTWTDGKEYPLFKVEISSGSHPFFTGKQTVVDTAGRVQKFKTRMKKASSKADLEMKKKAKESAKSKKIAANKKTKTSKKS